MERKQSIFKVHSFLYEQIYSGTFVPDPNNALGRILFILNV